MKGEMIMWIFSRLWHCFIGKCRKLKWRCQRFLHGWADEDTWDIDWWFIKTLSPMLKKFKEDNDSHPFKLSEEEWNTILDNMVYYLEGMKEEVAVKQLYGEGANLTVDKYKEISNHMTHSKEEFFKLFTQYFYDLWW